MLLNNIANWLKVAVIWFTDFANWVHDPFQEFDRPLNQKRHEYLWEKAAQFEDDMKDFFWPEYGIYLYTLPGNSGDQALWHGIYTAMRALKYSVTSTEMDLTALKDCVPGLFFHQSPTGELRPRLIRGWRADGTYEDEVSNDQASGHLCGIYFLWKYGNIDCRELAKKLITGLADEVSIHNGQLVNADGSPTKHGKLDNSYLSDPLNITLCLAIYRAAFAITSEPMYLARYDRLVKEYRPILSYAKVKLWWWDERQAGHRAAIHYSILCDLEASHDLHRKYLRGLLRVWKIERKSANPWIYYLMRRVCLNDPADLDKCVKHLQEFTLEDKKYNAERINSDEVETFKWGGHLRVRQPLPRWRVGSQDFFWQRHLYSADDWIGNGSGNLRHNGGDYLIAYWGLRSLRLINSNQ